MASFISLLILNKATTQPRTHWPLQPQTISSAADALYNMEAQLVLCVKKQTNKHNSYSFRICFAQ